jgi:ornithine cyclodeaminase/alanine dehydrogenase-like protein (mu-crystallin family)
MALIFLNAEETRRLLPMDQCIEVMKPAMIAASSGSMYIPPRTLFQLQDDSGFFAVMPGASKELGTYGAKVVSYHPANSASDLPAIQGFVAVFDHQTGQPRAIMDGGVITDIRTAAASGLATQLLARPDAGSCGIFGAGALADVHLQAMCTVRPVEECVIWARRREQAEALAEKHRARSSVAVRATDDPGEAGACDIVCTTTASPEPVLHGNWVKPGAHINLVGAHNISSRESDTNLIKKSTIYVDLLESTLNEGGDVMIPIREGAVNADHIIGEIGQLLTGDIHGRTNQRQITVYNSLGITSQDLYAARHVMEKALEQGAGTQVSF